MTECHAVQHSQGQHNSDYIWQRGWWSRIISVYSSVLINTVTLDTQNKFRITHIVKWWYQAYTTGEYWQMVVVLHSLCKAQWIISILRLLSNTVSSSFLNCILLCPGLQSITVCSWAGGDVWLVLTCQVGSVSITSGLQQLQETS